MWPCEQNWGEFSLFFPFSSPSPARIPAIKLHSYDTETTQAPGTQEKTHPFGQRNWKQEPMLRGSCKEGIHGYFPLSFLSPLHSKDRITHLDCATGQEAKIPIEPASFWPEEQEKGTHEKQRMWKISSKGKSWRRESRVLCVTCCTCSEQTQTAKTFGETIWHWTTTHRRQDRTCSLNQTRWTA